MAFRIIVSASAHSPRHTGCKTSQNNYVWQGRGAGDGDAGVEAKPLGGERGRRLNPDQLVPDACRPEAEANLQSTSELFCSTCTGELQKL